MRELNLSEVAREMMTVGAVMDHKTKKTAKKELTHANPPSECDLCGDRLVTDFVDGKMLVGPWANMCMSCHALNGSGLGTGLGQHFRHRKDDGKWVKVAG